MELDALYRDIVETSPDGPIRRITPLPARMMGAFAALINLAISSILC